MDFDLDITVRMKKPSFMPMQYPYPEVEKFELQEGENSTAFAVLKEMQGEFVNVFSNMVGKNLEMSKASNLEEAEDLIDFDAMPEGLDQDSSSSAAEDQSLLVKLGLVSKAEYAAAYSQAEGKKNYDSLDTKSALILAWESLCRYKDNLGKFGAWGTDEQANINKVKTFDESIKGADIHNKASLEYWFLEGASTIKDGLATFAFGEGQRIVAGMNKLIDKASGDAKKKLIALRDGFQQDLNDLIGFYAQNDFNNPQTDWQKAVSKLFSDYKTEEVTRFASMMNVNSNERAVWKRKSNVEYPAAKQAAKEEKLLEKKIEAKAQERRMYNKKLDAKNAAKREAQMKSLAKPRKGGK